MEQKSETNLIDVTDMKKTATYSLPISVWLWLKDEARRRNSNASALIVDLVSQEQKEVAA